MDISITQRLLDHYQSKRDATGTPTSIPEDNSQLWAYRQAAAVLHCFFPEKLVPPTDIPRHKNPRLLLFDEIAYSPGRYSEGLFTIDLESRKKALLKLGSREEMLQVYKRQEGQPLTTLQQMWESYLQTGKFPSPEKLNYKDLTNLSQIVTWLEGIDPSTPKLSDIQEHIRKKSVLSNFEHLVTENFTGRETELDLLKRHLTLAPSRPSNNILHAVVRDWFTKATPNPILSIYGPGGIGKSALSGKLLMDNLQSDDNIRFPFAYMPFDLGNLRIESPFTILVEAAGQFALQFPEYQALIDKFNENIRVFRHQRSSQINRQRSSNTRSILLEEYHKDDEELYTQFSKLLNAMGNDVERTGGRVRPILLAFDTFEEVEYRDLESLNTFWRMLGELIKSAPLLRVIITGRTSIEHLGVDKKLLTELPLHELKLPDAVLLLERLGMERDVAEVIAAQIGGNPLSLRLAANLVASDKNEATTKGIKDLNNRKWYFFQVDEQLIQGQLYKRILSHIHDENVKKLAHPGMVLRTITPEIILKVLAPQCQIEVETLEEAERLFNALRREQALVKSGNRGDLVYRQEIREAMIRLLMQDKPKETRDLRRAAIEYYCDFNDDASRAEEIYHRLALGEDDFAMLDSRWMSGIETSIASNLNEYSDKTKVWLASRINLEIPREIFQRADIADWERNIFRKVRQNLADFQLEPAIHLLGEREERTDASPLYALEAKAYLLMENYPEATVVLDEGIKKVSGSSNRGRLAELYWLRSQVEIVKSKIREADDSLHEAEKALEKASDPLPMIHVLCHRLLLRQTFQQPLEESSSTIRSRLNDACQRLDMTLNQHSTFVISIASQLLGEEYPMTRNKLSENLRTTYPMNPDMLTSENLQGLDEYREKWEIEDDRSIKMML